MFNFYSKITSIVYSSIYKIYLTGDKQQTFVELLVKVNQPICDIHNNKFGYFYLNKLK